MCDVRASTGTAWLAKGCSVGDPGTQTLHIFGRIVSILDGLFALSWSGRRPQNGTHGFEACAWVWIGSHGTRENACLAMVVYSIKKKHGHVSYDRGGIIDRNVSD